MRAFVTRAVIVTCVLLAAANVAAQTQGLARVGPVSTAHGFPTWYQDKTGITLEFCQPLVQADLDGGWCLLLPADTSVPEVFPAPFSEEHFYYAADAQLPNVGGAILVIGLEAAFAVGPVINGDQTVFARVRIRFDAPSAGDYTIVHPYGVINVTAAQGERVFYTEDIGILCAKGDFTCALDGRIGPFLLASNTPGGAELPGIVGPSGKLHIADPARLGPVTGSPFGTNVFRILGPGGAVLGETSDFTLMGRLLSGTLPGAVTVNKARYSLAAGATQGQVDVFATAFSAAQPRVPGGPIVGAVTPLLGFYPAACSVDAGGAFGAPAGVSSVQMFNTESRYYGQIVGAIPPAVCVQDYTARDAQGQAIPSFIQALVADIVTISQAEYDPANGGTLRVTAASSDAAAPPLLSASNIAGTFASGSTAIGTVGVPALMVTVTSAKGGRAQLEVTTLEGMPAFPATPIAGNDAYTILEDSATYSMNVLLNDTVGGAVITAADSPIITIVQQPGLGSAVVNGLNIDYTPALNAAGSDFLIYTVTVNGATSPQAFAAVTITPVNDAPVAVDDLANGVGNVGISVNLLANDSDVDAGDTLSVVITSAPAGVVYTLAGGLLTFTAPAGSYVFQYQARDAAGALSNIATATVNLAGGNETITLTRAQYTQSKRRWRVDGTSSVSGGQQVFIMYANGTFADGTSAAGFLVGSTVEAGGVFTLDFALAGANDPRNPTSGLFSQAPTSVYATSDLGGASLPLTIQLK